MSEDGTFPVGAYFEKSFDPSDLETLEVRFVYEAGAPVPHRMELNCGLKMKINLDDVAALEMLCPRCGELLSPLEKGLGECGNCSGVFRRHQGPLALEPGPINHVFLFTPSLRDWFVEVLDDYLPALEGVFVSMPLECVFLAYVDAGSGTSSTFLRKTYSGRLMEVYRLPLVKVERI